MPLIQKILDELPSTSVLVTGSTVLADEWRRQTYPESVIRQVGYLRLAIYCAQRQNRARETGRNTELDFLGATNAVHSVRHSKRGKQIRFILAA